MRRLQLEQLLASQSAAGLISSWQTLALHFIQKNVDIETLINMSFCSSPQTDPTTGPQKINEKTSLVGFKEQSVY